MSASASVLANISFFFLLFTCTGISYLVVVLFSLKLAPAIEPILLIVEQSTKHNRKSCLQSGSIVR